MRKNNREKDAAEAIEKLKSSASSIEEISPSELKNKAGVDSLDDIEVTPTSVLDAKAKTQKFIPVDRQDGLSKEDLASVQRKAYRSPDPLICTRGSNQKHPGINYVDLSWFDKEKKEYVGVNRIPMFYRELYKHAYGMENFVLYCKTVDIQSIKAELMADAPMIKRSIEIKKKQLDELDRSLDEMDSVTE